jgi:hypothetical protein
VEENLYICIVGWAAPLSMEEKLILPNRIFLPLILSTCLTDCGKIYYLKSNRRRQERLIGRAFSEGLTLYQEPVRGVHCCTSMSVVFAVGEWQSVMFNELL